MKYRIYNLTFICIFDNELIFVTSLIKIFRLI